MLLLVDIQTVSGWNQPMAPGSVLTDTKVRDDIRSCDVPTICPVNSSSSGGNRFPALAPSIADTCESSNRSIASSSPANDVLSADTAPPPRGASGGGRSPDEEV